MKDRKYCLKLFSIYDHTRIQEHLQTMAAKGWMIEKTKGLLWSYRRIQPQSIPFSVVYFPEASQYDPAPTEEQNVMLEFCQRDGWIKAIQLGQMLVFYNLCSDPTPIETDPEVQVATIHRAMRKVALKSNYMMLILCIWQLIFSGIQFFADPIDFLASPIQTAVALLWLCDFLAMAVELYYYYHWYHQARKAAKQGIFLPNRKKHTLSYILLGGSFVALLLAFVGTAYNRKLVALSFSVMFMVVILMCGFTGLLKRHGVSAKKNQRISSIVAMVLTMAVIGIVCVYVIKSGLNYENKPVGSYEIHGISFKVFEDAIPLRVEDLTETENTQWSTEARKTESLILSHTEYRQWPLSENRDIPELDYTVIEVKQPFLYEYCKTALLKERQDVVQDGEVLLEEHYDPIDADPWGAEEAYRLYWSSGYLDKYFLCYGDKLVEITLDEAPTALQMETVGQKLGDTYANP